MRSIAYHSEMGAKGWGNCGIINIPDFRVLAKNGETPDKGMERITSTNFREQES
jgi:hypothetical protein